MIVGGSLLSRIASVAKIASRAPPAPRQCPVAPFVEETGALVSLLVWLAFGAIAVVPAFEHLTWQTAAYAVLSLTVVRMVPVAVALAGSLAARGG